MRTAARARPLAIAALALGLSLAGAALALAWPRPSRVTRENFDRISDEMCREEVEAILGPPGDYSTGPVVAPVSGGVLVGGASCARAHWWGDEGHGCVAFDASGKVVGVRFWPGAVLASQGPFERLLWRLQSRWRALSP